MTSKFQNKSFVRNKDLFVVLALTFLNLILKSIFLTSYSYWLDEASQVYMSSKGLEEIYRTTLTGSNGPVYTMLLSLWMNIFGYYEFSTRFLSVIISSLTIPVFYSFVKKHWNSAVALGAGLIFTLSNWQIYYAHEARSYTLITLLTVISFSLFFDLLKKQSIKKLITYTLINTLLLYIHLIPILAFFVQGLITLFFIRKQFKFIWPIWGGMAISLGLLSIWLLQNQWFGGNETVWMPKPNIKTLYNMFIAYFNSKFVLFLYLVLGIGAGILSLKRKQYNRLESGVVLWGVLPILIVYMASVYYNPRFTHRYMLFATPGLYLSFVVFLHKLSKNRMQVFWGVLSISLLLMAVSLNLKMKYNGNWRDAIAYVKQEKHDGDVVASIPYYTNLPFVFYYDIEQFKKSVGEYPSLKDSSVFFVNSKEIYNKPTFKNAKRLILVTSSHTSVVDPDGEILKYAKEHYKQEKVHAFRSVQVHVFNLKQKPELYLIPVSIRGNKGVVKDNDSSRVIGCVDPNNEYFSILETKSEYFNTKGLQEFDIIAQVRYSQPNSKSGVIFSVEKVGSSGFLQYHFSQIRETGAAGEWNEFSQHIILEEPGSLDNNVKILLRRLSHNDTVMVKDVKFSFYQ